MYVNTRPALRRTFLSRIDNVIIPYIQNKNKNDIVYLLDNMKAISKEHNNIFDITLVDIIVNFYHTLDNLDLLIERNFDFVNYFTKISEEILYYNRSYPVLSYLLRYLTKNEFDKTILYYKDIIKTTSNEFTKWIDHVVLNQI